MINPLTPLSTFDPTATSNMREWRLRILNGILRGIFALWLVMLVGGINNVVKAYKEEGGLHDNPLALAASVITVYILITLLLVLITFRQRIRYEIRAGLLLFILYVIGAIGLFLSALSGDGRIFLFTFVVITAILFNLRYSLLALALSLLTLGIAAKLIIFDVIQIPIQRQVNATDPSSWFSGSVVFIVLSIATLISITYLLRTLEHMYAEAHTRATELSRLYTASQDLAASLLDPPALLNALARHMVEALDATSGYIISVNQAEANMMPLAEYWAESAALAERKSDMGATFRFADYPTIMRAIPAGETLVLQSDTPHLSGPELRQFSNYGIQSMLFVPILARGKLLGNAEIWESRRRRDFTASEIQLAQALASHAGSIIENARLFAETRQRESELQTIFFISSALRVATNVMEIVHILVRQASAVVGAAHGSIFLCDEQSGDLISSGWYSADDEETNVNPTSENTLRHHSNEGITGRVVSTGKIYITDDLHTDPVAVILLNEQERLRNVHSGVSLPLNAHSRTIGVLHVWLRERRPFTETEIHLLTAIAEIAGNAIHRATLYEQTILQAEELALAYENTLAGWGRALEMRDELTEGHTRRVTELALRLAQSMGIPEAELMHIQRGAMLHDIGKMGIPDSILKKSSALTPEEQELMRCHPKFAYDMLAPIEFLRPALHIPFCHHERWDGSGYPRGLRGEEIPLAARIFAVADVWDAITSDRPYRPAWTKEKAREYIITQSGRHFEPRIVEAFLSLNME